MYPKKALYCVNDYQYVPKNYNFYDGIKQNTENDESYFQHKRIDHFNQMLDMFSNEKSIDVPQDVLDTILMEMKKEGKSINDLNYNTTKNYLKKHSDKKYNQYYDNIFHIISRLNGDEPLNITSEMKEKMNDIFLLVNASYNHNKSLDIGFIHYPFVFNKICKILGYADYSKYFPIIKNQRKIEEWEAIWEKICADLDIPN